MTIEQAEPSLQITQEIVGAQGPFTAKFKYSTDGKEVSNVNGPSELKSTAKWDNETLVIESAGKFRGNDLKVVDKWPLSSDGKHLSSPGISSWSRASSIRRKSGIRNRRLTSTISSPVEARARRWMSR